MVYLRTRGVNLTSLGRGGGYWDDCGAKAAAGGSDNYCGESYSAACAFKKLNWAKGPTCEDGSSANCSSPETCYNLTGDMNCVDKSAGQCCGGQKHGDNCKIDTDCPGTNMASSTPAACWKDISCGDSLEPHCIAENNTCGVSYASACANRQNQKKPILCPTGSGSECPPEQACWKLGNDCPRQDKNNKCCAGPNYGMPCVNAEDCPCSQCYNIADFNRGYASGECKANPTSKQ